MIEIQNWGLIDYQVAWEKQKQLVEEIQKGRNKNVFVLCEHPTVITIGKNGTVDNLLLSDKEFEEKNVKVIWNNRGGDVTMHNPGQLVGYPIFNLSSYKEDLHWFLREIEERIIETVAEFGIASSRVEGLTGVWIENQRKICAIGMHCSRWVTSHGFALNVANDLGEFGYIVPCGIDDKEVTSISKEAGTQVDIGLVRDTVITKFSKKF